MNLPWIIDGHLPDVSIDNPEFFDQEKTLHLRRTKLLKPGLTITYPRRNLREQPTIPETIWNRAVLEHSEKDPLYLAKYQSK